MAGAQGLRGFCLAILLITGPGLAQDAPRAAPTTSQPAAEKPSREVIDSVLASASSVEVLSLRPYGVPSAAGPSPDQGRFHGWEVLGRTPVGPQQTGQVVTALRKEVSGLAGGFMLCFEPRHGVRLTSSAGAVDLVICFECQAMEVYRDGAEEPMLTSISDAPKALLDSLLVSARIPQAPASE